MFNEKELAALKHAGVGTSGRMAYALVIYKQEHDNIDVTYDFLSAQMGVSFDRAQRVIADLKKAGFVATQQEYKQPVTVHLLEVPKHESNNS